MLTKNATLHDTDFHAWANEQAALLRAGRLAEADVANIAEEIESIGRSEKRELINRLAVLLLHSMKWRHQPVKRSPSWRATIEQQRIHLEDHLDGNPSLKSQLDQAMAKAYRYARIEAEHETGIPRNSFPTASPFTFEEAMNEDFWPD